MGDDQNSILTKKPKILNQPPDAKVLALVMLLALLWGGNSVSIKIGLRDMPPLMLAGVRFALGLTVIVLWARHRGIQLRLNAGELRPLAMLTGLFLAQIAALNIGTKFTTASRSTVFVTTYPFFTALFAHFLVPGDRLTVQRAVGICVAFGGVLVAFAEGLRTDTGGTPVGDTITLLSGCLLGLRTVVTKRLVQSIHPYRLLVWLMVFSLPCFFTTSLLFERGWRFNLSGAGAAAIAYQGVVVAGFCFITWTTILERYSPGRLVVLFFLTPLFGVLLSHLLLKDPISISLLLGAGLVALGIYLVNRRTNRNKK